MSFTLGSRKIYRKPIPISEVIRVIEKYFKLEPKGIENIPLSEAVGRVLAEDVYAIYDYPPFDRALYDGYSLIADDIVEAFEDRPIKLTLKGRISAGEDPRLELRKGECCEVATGAPVPYPADTVVPIEYTREESGSVYIYKRFSKGFGIQYAGTDCVKGEVVAKKGTLLTPLLIGVLASVGITNVKVYTKPKIGIIAIGNELVNLGRPLGSWKVYESNSVMVRGFLKNIGVEAHYLGLVKDDCRELKEALNKALDQFDIIITIGGTSAGYEDIVYKVLREYKPGVIIHGLKVKPGSPTLIAVAKSKLVIGLPGFPLSCFSILHLVVKDILDKTMLNLSRRREVFGVVLRDVEGTLGYVKLVPALIRKVGDTFYAYPIHLHSGFLLKVSLCDGFIIVPENTELVHRGESVKILLTNFRESDLVFIGSHCPLAERLLLKLSEGGFRVKYIFIGSIGGVMAIKDTFADIAGIHIYSPKGKGYNVDFLNKVKLKDIVLIRGYTREQGFILKEGIGNIISGFKDIVNLKLKFINRNKGSGTRALIDHLIERETKRLRRDVEEFKSMIRGYNVEVSSHESVALAIKQGKADVGVGIRYVAEKYGLGFVKIIDEHYDFLIKKSFISSKVFNSFIQLLTDYLRNVVHEYVGYKFLEETGKVIYEA